MTSTDTVNRITVEELAHNLSDILTRVQKQRETFTIEHDGMAVATLGPAQPPAISVDELVALVGNLRMPEGMADDLEAIHAAQGFSKAPEWPD